MRDKEMQTRLMYAFHRFGKINIMPKTGISKMEFFALQVIDDYQQKTGMPGIYVSDLAQNLKIASSQTSRMLKNLEERNLIGRDVDGRDRRNTCVFLTEGGRQVCLETRDYVTNYMERVFQVMGEERIEIGRAHV